MPEHPTGLPTKKEIDTVTHPTTHTPYEDVLDIRNLAAHLAHLADEEADLSRYIQCFTEDALWSLRTSVLNGRDEILAGARERRRSGSQGPGTHTRHIITTHTVDVDGDEAHGQIYLLFMADTSTHPHVRSIAHYADRYRRTATGWKLSERLIEVA